jgi:hypothetical protein
VIVAGYPDFYYRQKLEKDGDMRERLQRTWFPLIFDDLTHSAIIGLTPETGFLCFSVSETGRELK